MKSCQVSFFPYLFILKIICVEHVLDTAKVGDGLRPGAQRLLAHIMVRHGLLMQTE
jgi:hypothetical protein